MLMKTDVRLLPPSLRGLSTVLRDRSMWPEGFQWYYGDCLMCAMGLAQRMWESIENPLPYDMSCIFNMPEKDVHDIFLSLNGNNWYGSVTPEHVGDAIDAYLLRHNL